MTVIALQICGTAGTKSGIEMLKVNSLGRIETILYQTGHDYTNSLILSDDQKPAKMDSWQSVGVCVWERQSDVLLSVFAVLSRGR